MAGIIDFGDFERKTCASCGCYWDYNIFDKSKLKTVFDKYFFLDIDYCPNCYYVGHDVAQLNKKVKEEIDSGRYKKYLKTFKENFMLTTRQEAFQFIVHAMICEEMGDYQAAAISYYNGALLEQDMIDKYVESSLYSERDERDRKEYEKEVEKHFISSYECAKKCLSEENIDMYIFLCGLSKKLKKQEEFVTLFTKIVKGFAFNKQQAEVLKELRG